MNYEFWNCGHAFRSMLLSLSGNVFFGTRDTVWSGSYTPQGLWHCCRASVYNSEVVNAELKHKAERVQHTLLKTYGQPVWRKILSPLDELVSTILSQNTNDRNRDRAFNALRSAFADWSGVRDAPTEAVITAIRPAGLANQKGPRIQQVLREITAERGDLSLRFLAELPLEEARQWLLRFKGVGPKTAAIVLLFALQRPAFPVDTHVHRVTGRLGLRPSKMSADSSHMHLEAVFRKRDYYAAHMNLIQLGREICRARRPRCPECALSNLCDYWNVASASTPDLGRAEA